MLAGSARSTAVGGATPIDPATSRAPSSLRSHTATSAPSVGEVPADRRPDATGAAGHHGPAAAQREPRSSRHRPRTSVATVAAAGRDGPSDAATT